ncbi:hypothetical protein ACWDG9_16720 [Streptomyces sp. NPDC001073]
MPQDLELPDTATTAAADRLTLFVSGENAPYPLVGYPRHLRCA